MHSRIPVYSLCPPRGVVLVRTPESRSHDDLGVRNVQQVIFNMRDTIDTAKVPISVPVQISQRSLSQTAIPNAGRSITGVISVSRPPRGLPNAALSNPADEARRAHLWLQSHSFIGHPVYSTALHEQTMECI